MTAASKGLISQILSLFLTISSVLASSAGVSAYVITADRSVAEKEKVYLYGHVRLVTDDYRTESDSAVFFRKDSLVVIPSEMLLFKGDSIKTEGKSGEYDIRRKLLKVRNQMTKKTDSFSMNSLLMEIMSEESIMIFSGECIAEFEGGGKVLYSDTSFYDITSGILKCYSGILLNDSAGGYSIRSDTAYILSRDSIYDFFPSTELQNDSFTLKGDSSAYFGKEGLFRTFSRGVIEGSNSRIVGDSIFAFASNDSIDYISIYGNIEFSRWGSEQSDSIECDSMNLEVSSGGLSKAFMYGINKAVLILKEKENDADKD